MQKYILEKAFGYKLFMLLSFSIFALVMYQGHISSGGIYSILFFGTLALCAFQISSFFYVIFIKRTVEIYINEEEVYWKIYDNKKLTKERHISLSDIKKLIQK